MKIMVGMICPLSSDDDVPIYHDVTDEEYETMTARWNANLVNAFYKPVIKKLTEMETTHNEI